MKSGDKIKELWKKKKRLFIGAIVILILTIIGVVIAIAFILGRKQNNRMNFPEMTGNRQNTVSATGTTSIGMLSDEFEVESLETQLYIEEVYVATGDEVVTGTPILKLSQETLEKARAELTKAAKEAELAYRAGAIEYEQSKITAKYDYDTAILEGTYAKEVYDEQVATLAKNVTQAEEALTEAKDLIAEYTEALENNTYYTEYKVAELKETYDTNRALLSSKVGEWGIGWSEVTGLNDDGTAATSTTSVGMNTQMGNAGGGSERSQQLKILTQLYSVVQDNETEYKQALENYNTAVETATFQVQEKQLEISSLQAALTQAQSDYEEQSISAKLDYQTTLAKSEQAQSDYDTALSKAEETYSSLETTKEDAADTLALFEESVGDGYFYAGSNGTIVMNMYRAGDYLQTDTPVIAYSNPEEISVVVSVDQTDIAQLSVGDSALVSISGYENFEGVISEINPVSTSTSRASVTYSVTVLLEGDVSELASNLTAQVIFQTGGEQK